jgi:hypothetical protein
MTIPAPVLPADVLALLAPAGALVRQQAVEETRAAQLPVLVRKAQTAVRANGSDGQYDIGAAEALKAAFPGLIDARRATAIRLDARGAPPSIVDNVGEELEQDYEDEADDDECDGSMSCCGYCSDHEEHHDNGNEDHVVTSPRHGERYCTDCEHWCDQY